MSQVTASVCSLDGLMLAGNKFTRLIITANRQHLESSDPTFGVDQTQHELHQLTLPDLTGKSYELQAAERIRRWTSIVTLATIILSVKANVARWCAIGPGQRQWRQAGQRKCHPAIHQSLIRACPMVFISVPNQIELLSSS